jgi:mono/diheme cytochrome c family protein
MHRDAPNTLMVVLVSALSVVERACRQPPAPAAGPASATPEAHAPGLGELMTLQQMRHTKRGGRQAGNWELAAYELDELGEGFDDVEVPSTHKDSPVAPKEAVARFMTQPLGDRRAAVTGQDSAAFGRAYDVLTAACNACHQATNFGFNRVQRPETNPYPNQVFSPISASAGSRPSR